MQRQFLLAIVLSFLVIYGWQALYPPPPPPKPQAQPQTVTSTPSGTQAPTTVQATPAEPQVAVELPKALVAAATEQDIVVENEMLTATFTTRGGVLKSWRLKSYRDGIGESLELIPQKIENANKPFTLVVDDAATTAKLKQALFLPDKTSMTVDAAGSTLVFEYEDAAGLKARKEFGFSTARPYIIKFTATVSQGSTPLTPTVDWGPALGTGVVNGGMSYAPAPQPIFYRDRKVTRVAIGKIEEHRQEQGTFGFAGVDDHYFLSALVLRHAAGASALRSDRRAGRGQRRPGAAVHLVARQLAAGRERRRVLLRSEGSRRAAGDQAATWCARSTSACSTGWSCRCCAR